MAKTGFNNVKLGIFVLAGLAFLILLLYMIGKNQNLFGKTFILKTRFENVHGLVGGNSVRFAGIDAGTVKSVRVINDTTIEVSMMIKMKMKNYIRKDTRASIATDGLMGNRLVNLESGKTAAPMVEENDILASEKGVDTDEMLKVLSKTNADIAEIARNLKSSVQRFNSSTGIWDLLDDPTIPKNIRQSMTNIRQATIKMNELVANVNGVIDSVKAGNGSLGELVADTALAYNLNEAIFRIRNAGIRADSLASQVSDLVGQIDNSINKGTGTVHTLLKDPETVEHLQSTLINIEKGTAAFNENMEALKHSILFRGYFKRLEQQKSARQKITMGQ